MRRALGVFERAAALTHDHSPFVVVVALRLSSVPTPERLRAALDRLQRRHPPLAVRLVERTGRPWFEPEGVGPIPLRAAERGGEEGWLAMVADELNRRLDTRAGPLARCALLAPPPAEPAGEPAAGEIVLAFHHAVVDAASATALVRRLLADCGGEEADGTEPATGTEGSPGVEGAVADVTPHGGVHPAPSADPGPPPVEALFPPAHRGVRGGIRRLGFLARQIGDEVAHRFGGSRGELPAAGPGARCRALSFELPPAATTALVRATRRRRVTLNGALGAAFLLAAAAHLRGGRAGRLRHFSFADLRPHLEPPPGDDRLGAFIAMLRYGLRVEPGRGFWPLAREVTTRVDAGLRRGEAFAAAALSETLMRAVLRRGRGRMAATAVSYTGVARLAPRYGPLGVRGVHAFVSTLGVGPEVAAQARLFAGRLLVDVVHLDADLEPALAWTVADEVAAILHRAAAEGG